MQCEQFEQILEQQDEGALPKPAQAHLEGCAACRALSADFGAIHDMALELGAESIWASLRQLGDVQLAAFDLLVQAPRTERLRAYLPELFTRYREVIQEQLDRVEADGRIRLTVPREVLVPLVLNTVLGFGLYYVVTRDDESCLRALSAFSQLAASLIEPVE